MNVRTLIGEAVHRAEDFRFLKGAGRFVDDLQARGHAARGGAAQPRGAWPHPQDRCVGGARHAGRACGHDRGGDRRSVPVIPLRLANLPEFKNYLQPVIASDKVRYVGEPVAVVVAETPGAGRGRARSDRARYRAAAGAAGPACGGGRRRRCCSRRRAATARCATRRRSAMPMRRSPRRNTRARKHSAATG